LQLFLLCCNQLYDLSDQLQKIIAQTNKKKQNKIDTYKEDEEEEEKPNPKATEECVDCLICF
jgi:hypothetical protein